VERRRYTAIFIIVLVNFLGATIVLPTLPLYASRHFDAPPHLITWLNTSFFIAQLLAAPLLGRLSDKYGRIPVLIVSQIGTVISFLMMGFAGSLEMLFLARILDGVTGGNVIVAQAYLTDISPREQRTRALGLVFAAFGLGYTVGPALGGALSIFGEHAPFFVAAAISLATVILTWRTLDESLSAEERLARRHDVHLHPRELLANIPLMLIFIIAFFAQASMSMMQSTFALYGEDVIFARLDRNMVGLGVGLLLGTVGVGQFLTQLVLIQRIVPRYGERRTVMIGAALRAFGLLSLTMFVSPFLVGPVSLVAFAVGSGLMMPSLQSLATTSVDERTSGAVLGIYQSCASLGIITGSAIAGALYAAQPTLPYLIGGLVFIGTLIPAGLLFRRGERALAEAA
jgi:DHA1 family tetracycline resistance protein-like MFS transporter